MIIALSGHKGSGKDTAADYLAKEYKLEKLSFAETLKQSTAEMYGLPLEYFYDQELKEKALTNYPVDNTDKFSEQIHRILFREFNAANGKNSYDDYDDYEDRDEAIQVKLYWTPRALMILEGSIKRSVNGSFWINKLAEKIRNSNSRGFVISDLRYRTELEGLQRLFGSVEAVRVDRNLNIDSVDASERDLDDYKFDNIIVNTGTIEQLQGNLNYFVQSVIEKYTRN